jgi:hypothetical protein
MDPVYVLQASIRQGERVVARGIGRFVHRPDIGKSQEGCP